MKILLLGDINSSHLLKWIRSLSSSGFEIAVFTLNEPNQLILDSLSNIKVFSSVENSKNNFNGSELGKLKYLTAVSSLRRIVKSWTPDIVHAHYATSYGLLGALSGHKTLFISVWGSDIFEFPTKSSIHKKSISLILNQATKIFSASEILADKTRLLTKKDVFVIPFGIDTDFFDEKINSDADEIIIGTVKSLETIYGIDILLTAFAKLQKLRPLLLLRLQIVGGGSQENNLKQLASDLNINSSVEFIGKIPFDYLPEYYKRFNIFANLSRSESFGVSVLEAMSTELPVVVTSTGGLNEIVSSECGIHVSVENVDETVNAFLELVDNRFLRSKMGKAGRTRVKQLYDWNSCVDKMSYFYKQYK